VRGGIEELEEEVHTEEMVVPRAVEEEAEQAILVPVELLSYTSITCTRSLLLPKTNIRQTLIEGGCADARSCWEEVTA
jgi:hypothetical protein